MPRRKRCPNTDLQSGHGECIDIGSLCDEHRHFVLIGYDKLRGYEHVRREDYGCEARVFDRFLATQPEVNDLDDASFSNTEIVLLGGQ
jgi:hypothetical protein